MAELNLRFNRRRTNLKIVIMKGWINNLLPLCIGLAIGNCIAYFGLHIHITHYSIMADMVFMLLYFTYKK